MRDADLITALLSNARALGGRVAQSAAEIWEGAQVWAQRWLAEDGIALREWLFAHTPQALHDLIEAAPLWALGGLVALVGFGSLWAVVAFVRAGINGARFAGKAVTKPGEAIEDVLAAQPTRREVKEVRRGVSALERQVSAQSEMLAAVKAQLDLLQAQAVAAGAKPLGAEERVRRDEAVGAIVADAAPAAREAAKDIAAGDLESAIAALKRDARADKQAAAEKWRRVAALARGVNDSEALEAYQEAFTLQPEDFWTCIELARLNLRHKGDVVAARRAAEAALAAARVDREISVANNDLGDVAMQAGDLAAARARYEQSLAVDERLAQQSPDSAVAQRDLSVSLKNLGDVAMEAGDLAAARARLEQSLGVDERLAQQNPDSAEAQRDLSVSFGMLGDVAMQAGDLAAARGRYEQVNAVAERLAQQNPDSAEAQLHLAVSFERLGRVAMQAGDLNAARQWFERELVISQNRMDRDAASAQAKRFHSVVLGMLGDVAMQAGDNVRAIECYKKASDLVREMARKSPETISHRLDLIELDFRLAQLGNDQAGIQAARKLFEVLAASGASLGNHQKWFDELRAMS